MDWTTRSIETCIKVRCDLLHIDTTVDITLEKGKKLSINDVVERAATLIE